MRFGIFHEHQLPRPWTEGAEERLLAEALEQVEAADRLSYDYIWEVEHHFLEEYSHSSAPEVFLAACAARTSRIRLGHGIMLSPPPYNHPARQAERLAVLDLISHGRVDWGTGESASRLELEGFQIAVEDKQAMWREAVEQIANMMAMTPYPGLEGQYFSMPCRNVIPKPKQKPHPPIWLACQRREMIREAARNGVGALTFAFLSPEEARDWAAEYYAVIKSEDCVPIGHSVNANIASVTGFYCHDDHDVAVARGLEGVAFFAYGLGHNYRSGTHVPGYTDLWAEFQAKGGARPELAPRNALGTPDELRQQMRVLSDAGIDQIIFIQQAGNIAHDEVLASMRLFAERVMPEFHAEEAEKQARKDAELAPHIAAAMARKSWMAPVSEAEAPRVSALGRTLGKPQAPPRVVRSGE